MNNNTDWPPANVQNLETYFTYSENDLWRELGNNGLTSVMWLPMLNLSVDCTNILTGSDDICGTQYCPNDGNITANQTSDQKSDSYQNLKPHAGPKHENHFELLTYSPDTAQQNSPEDCTQQPEDLSFHHSRKPEYESSPELEYKFNPEPEFKVAPATQLCEEGPSYEPIYVLDASQDVFMYLNVKFYKTQNYVMCLHPNCHYLESILGHFSEPLPLEKFRFHVSQKHRSAAAYDEMGLPIKNFYCCHICYVQMDSAEDLKDHRRSYHQNSEMPPVLCEICGDNKPESVMSLHKFFHKSKEEQEVFLAENAQRHLRINGTKPLNYPCSQCDKIFKLRKELQAHELMHTPFQCEQQIEENFCGKILATDEDTENSHKRRGHGTQALLNSANLKEKSKNENVIPKGERFRCKICLRDYRSEVVLKLHHHLVHRSRKKHNGA